MDEFNNKIENVEDRQMGKVSSSSQDLQGQIVLGVQTENPLSTENMLLAWNNLYDQNLTNLEPSHYYVKFSPTIEEFEVLQNLENIELFNYPLDREILVDGDRYREPGIPDNVITPHYAIVEYDFQTPISSYEILSELVVVDYNSHWIEEAYRIKNLFYDGVPHGTFNSAYPSEVPPRERNKPEPPDCGEGCVAV